MYIKLTIITNLTISYYLHMYMQYQNNYCLTMRNMKPSPCLIVSVQIYTHVLYTLHVKYTHR